MKRPWFEPGGDTVAGCIARVVKLWMISRRQVSHIAILSAGYGLVSATEPIGMYNETLKTSWWPHRILERCLLAYCSALRDFVCSGICFQNHSLRDNPETHPVARRR